MSKFTLEIRTDNAAFGGCETEAGQEIARILRKAADNAENGDLDMFLKDINGNSVGYANYHPDKE